MSGDFLDAEGRESVPGRGGITDRVNASVRGWRMTESVSIPEGAVREDSELPETARSAVVKPPAMG
ncbi:MAG: hypothetical protein LBQ79_05450 [Deltaproteobacteria bacterium]|nr:hypothetical protein [Deltaproteobacteria bacterium]